MQHCDTHVPAFVCIPLTLCVQYKHSYTLTYILLTLESMECNTAILMYARLCAFPWLSNQWKVRMQNSCTHFVTWVSYEECTRNVSREYEEWMKCVYEYRSVAFRRLESKRNISKRTWMLYCTQRVRRMHTKVGTWASQCCMSNKACVHTSPITHPSLFPTTSTHTLLQNIVSFIGLFCEFANAHNFCGV